MSLSKPATEVAEEYATAMEEAIESATNAEAERDAALARVSELEAAISAVNGATQATHDKALDLYWLGRRNIEEAIAGPGGPAIERIMTQYEDEAGKIAIPHPEPGPGPRSHLRWAQRYVTAAIPAEWKMGGDGRAEA